MGFFWLKELDSENVLGLLFDHNFEFLHGLFRGLSMKPNSARNLMLKVHETFEVSILEHTISILSKSY